MTMGLKANADGSGAIQVGGSDAITITSGLNTTFAGTASVATGALYPLVSGTAKAYNWNGLTNNTYIDFDTIPSWVKRITVMFNGVSTNGTSNVTIQLGSGTVQTTGYLGAGSAFIAGAAGNTFNLSSGFSILDSGAATAVRNGDFTFKLLNSNIWAGSGLIGQSDTTRLAVTSGVVSLSGTLDRVRITTVSPGTDTFDAGSINILYE